MNLGKNICTPMLIAALFTIAKIWKQPKCTSVDEWIKKTRYIYTMEYYAGVKKEGTLPFCNSIEGPGESYAQQNQPVRKGKSHSYVKSNEQNKLTTK